MSQNLDATAINQIHALISAQGVNEIISKIGAVRCTGNSGHYHLFFF